MVKEARSNKLSKKGVDGKPINSKSKGYGDLGWRSPKELAKVHGNKELEWAKDAQGKEMGRGRPNGGNRPRKPESNGMGQRSPK